LFILKNMEALPMDTLNTLDVLSDAPGQKLFALGNQAIARGAIEAGVQVVAAYPGTPSTEIAETLIDNAGRLNIKAQWSVNEKVAFGTAMGAALCGVRSMAIMKHVGVNLVMDPLITAAYIGTRGGLLLLEAEDPGQWSSQNEQDNRFLAREAYLPVLEPSSVEEAQAMTRLAFELSEQYQHPFMLRSCTRIGHARSDITLGEINKTRRAGVFEREPDRYVMVPAVARRGRRRIVERMAQIQAAVDSWPCNRLDLKENASLGIITSGLAYSYTLEALNWMGLRSRVAMLKIGTPNPLPRELILRLLRSVPRVLVIEELEPFIENEVRAIAQKAAISLGIEGKNVIPLIGELSTRKVSEALAKVTGADLPSDFAAIDRRVADVQPLLPLRPPTLCAGCPHRASHYAMNLASRQIQQETGQEPIRSGDIGCYALGGEAPLSAIDTSVFMGSGFDLANGMAQAVATPIIAHMGDSTFFHSGIAPMLNAVQHKTRLVMVVLDNLTTAMTGSQPSPSSHEGDLVTIQPEKIARAAGIKFIRVVDPLDLDQAVRTLIQAARREGPSLVVFRRPCNILEQRTKRLRGEKTVPYRIDYTKCLAESDPPCTAACPLHLDARGYINLIKQGQWTGALCLIFQKTPFPGILGRICTHPCQYHCRRAEIDQSVAIAALKRSAVDQGGKIRVDQAARLEDSRSQDKPQKVAVVGSGPAGLMAAYDLRRLGYGVTIFEALPVPGGMLAAGIPEYRLPGSLVQDEIAAILKTGIELKLNMPVGRQTKIKQLLQEYQAVFLAVGAHQGRTLNIPGLNTLSGRLVVSGIDFLKDVRLGKKSGVRHHVVIIGGGNVAIDCARTCLRAGSTAVKVVYRRSRQQMPAISEEVEAAIKEGVVFEFNAIPVKVAAVDNTTAGLQCIHVRWGRDRGVRSEHHYRVPDSAFTLETNLIIAAVGEKPDLSLLEQLDGCQSANGDLVKADSTTLATAIPGLFAGGDAVSGPSTVVEALASGRRAALAINCHLQGQPLKESISVSSLEMGPLPRLRMGIAPQPRVSMPELPLSKRSGWQEVALGYDQDAARLESGRCLACRCLVCVNELGCPAILVENGRVSIDSAQCSGCGLCAEICPAAAIVNEPLK
jgi:indolepyruvate ferredoxin oxidoreductase, alpha subunit